MSIDLREEEEVIVTPLQPLHLARGTAVSVMLVDDSADERNGMKRQLLASELAIAGESVLGTEAVATARDLKPDVIVVAVEEPVVRGLRTIEALHVVVPNSPVVALSTLGGRDYLRQAMLAGARDYLVRPVDADEFEKTILSVHEQERKRSSLNEHVIESGHVGDVISVFGAKGGVGRTTIATNLAVALALKYGQRVAIVDLDLQLGDVSLLLDIVPERTIADLVPVVEKLDPELMRGFLSVHASGLKVLPAPLRPEEGEKVQAAHIRKILEVLSRTYDYVVVDTPRQLNDSVVTTLDMSNMVCLVASNQLTCLKSTKVCLGMLKSWRYTNDKVKLVMNQAHNGSSLPMNDAETAIDYPIFWKVPYDGHLVAASHWGKPFVHAQPGAKISQNIAALADAVSGSRTGGRGLLSRIRG
ncbi:MAG: AAA family ATPase [Chloroflexi bacterium]|nr:AAA family ATPase [Chloroflexota bacterium]